MRLAARPGHVLLEQRKEASGAGAIAPVDLQIVHISRRWRGVIANREQIVVLVVAESENESTVIDR